MYNKRKRVITCRCREISQDEYDVATNVAYKEKYDALDASNEEVRDD